MSDLQSFFAMGGYAVYVWSAYAITFIVILLNVLAARRSHKNQLSALRRARMQTASSDERTTHEADGL